MRKSKVLFIDFGGSFLGTPAREEVAPYLSSHLGDAFSLVAIDYECVAFGTDGTDISPHHWIEMARLVRSSYHRYDGFVIWHPIVTLAYTAAALSFIFENLAKPVVVTGAMVPLREARTDATSNLTSSICIAAYEAFDLPRIPEVITCFGGNILRAVRATVVSTSSYYAIGSPNFPPLGEIGDRICIQEKLLRSAPSQTKRFEINDNLEEGVVPFHIYPGFSSQVFESVVQQSGVKGIIITSFGGGNVPTDDAVLNAISAATRRGIIVLHLRKHLRGESGATEYAADALFYKHGAVRGSYLTPEAAFAKLSVTLGRGLSLHNVRELLQYDLRGEQSEAKGQIEDLWLPGPVAESTITLVKEINGETLRFLRQNPDKMHDLSPRAFEKLIAEIFKHHGYNVELTPETRDGGFDFRALFVDGLGQSFLSYVETKRYGPHNPVSIDIVRSLYGVVAASEAARGIIVTSSRFTKPAREFQARLMNRISLHDYNDVKRWLEGIQ